MRRTDFIDLKEAKKHVNEYHMSDNYYDSNINILKSDSKTDKSEKIADSEESDKFIKKSNTEKFCDKKEVWIRTYKEVLNTLSVNKESDYEKRVKELKNQICYIIWDSYTQQRKPSEILFRDIVWEVSPSEFRFTINEGYVTLNRAHIPVTLQIKVWALRAEYAKRDSVLYSEMRYDSRLFQYVRESFSIASSSSKN